MRVVIAEVAILWVLQLLWDMATSLAFAIKMGVDTMTKNRVITTLLASALLAIPLSVSAGFYDLAVTTAGDRVWNWDKSSSYVYTWLDPNANPNAVGHYYDYDNRSGYYQDTYLTFGLGGLLPPLQDIVSVSLNFNVLSVWTTGREDIGSIGAFGTVTYSGGIGLKSFDVTDFMKSILQANGNTANFSVNHTGFSGFTFGSAEGGDPAYLRFATANGEPSPVPEPGSALLVSLGLLGLAAAKRSRFSE